MAVALHAKHQAKWYQLPHSLLLVYLRLCAHEITSNSPVRQNKLVCFCMANVLTMVLRHAACLICLLSKACNTVHSVQDLASAAFALSSSWCPNPKLLIIDPD